MIQFFLVLMSLAQHFDGDKALSTVDAFSSCARREIIGESHFKRKIYAFTIKGQVSQPVLITSGVHGDEKMSVAVSLSLIRTFCEQKIRPYHRLVIVPILNPDGYSGKHRCKRGNGRCLDINRDGFRWRTPEGIAYRRLFERIRPVRYIDMHMTGNVILAPKSWTKAYTQSKQFVKNLQKSGLKWWSRNGHPQRMLISWASERGVPSLLIEIGRKTEHLKYAKPLTRKRISIVVKSLSKLLHNTSFSLPKKSHLRRGSSRYRHRKFKN